RVEQHRLRLALSDEPTAFLMVVADPDGEVRTLQGELTADGAVMVTDEAGQQVSLTELLEGSAVGLELLPRASPDAIAAPDRDGGTLTVPGVPGPGEPSRAAGGEPGSGVAGDGVAGGGEA